MNKPTLIDFINNLKEQLELLREEWSTKLLPVGSGPASACPSSRLDRTGGQTADRTHHATHLQTEPRALSHIK